MSILSWMSIILSLIGLICISVAAILDYNERNNTNASRFPFILGIIGLVTFFLGWLLFIFFLFMSKGLDLTMVARKQLGDALTDPNVIRSQIVEASDEKFEKFVNG